MDSIYIKKVLSGNIEAFKYFVETYKDFAVSLSYSVLKNNYLAEESVQESFIKAYDKLSTFKQNAKFKTWFGRIVINESLRRIKKNDTGLDFNEISEIEISDVECSMQNILDEERRFYIDKVFESLTNEESLVLELYYLKEFSIKEICSMTDWSPSKVKMLNLRGRKNFYVKLQAILKSEMKIVL
ncbi:MAG: sigma-70 family RNA polymerase sigma factor [Bacteroidales bacterium]